MDQPGKDRFQSPSFRVKIGIAHSIRLRDERAWRIANAQPISGENSVVVRHSRQQIEEDSAPIAQQFVRVDQPAQWGGNAGPLAETSGVKRTTVMSDPHYMTTEDLRTLRQRLDDPASAGSPKQDVLALLGFVEYQALAISKLNATITFLLALAAEQERTIEQLQSELTAHCNANQHQRG
jgi:hypothetical protein